MTRYRLEQIEAVIPSETAAPQQRFTTPERIASGDRHGTLYRMLRSQKARGFSLDAALAACHVENHTKCDEPIEPAKLDDYLRRVWNQEDSPEFAARSAGGEHGSFPNTEAGDAEFFAHRNANVARYDHRRGRWLTYQQHRWVPQSNGEINRLALETMRARQVAAATVSDDAGRAAAGKWAFAGEARKRLLSMLFLAQSIEPVADRGDNWDTDPWLLGVPNGVVDLRTGTLRDGRPEDRITMCANVAFDPHAVCPLYDQTVAEIFDGDAELIAYYDRYAGYSLTGDCREEALAFCWGDGANGKGTLMNTLACVMGEYADDLPFSALELHDRTQVPNDIAKIVGKRFITSSETGDTKRLNEARVKALTGRDPITTRFLYKEFFTFQPMAKFWLATNQKPEGRDTSVGFWRRIHLIPFTQSFAGSPNLRLKDDLRAEGPGILARAVRGCLEWQRLGLNPPAVVIEATQEYRAESMPLTQFFDERCVIQDGARATFGQLLDAYKGWLAGARDAQRLNRKQFSDALHARFQTDSSSTRNVTFLGVGVLTLGADYTTAGR